MELIVGFEVPFDIPKFSQLTISIIGLSMEGRFIKRPYRVCIKDRSV